MFSSKSKSIAKKVRTHQGITIVEVLTSIVVAMIGVFGVLIMIPFAVQQAQLGLDLDDSINLADDAYAEFQIFEFHRINEDGFLPWIDANNQVNVFPELTVGGGSQLIQPGDDLETDPNTGALLHPYSYMINRGPYWLDPLGIEAGFTTANIFEVPVGGIGPIERDQAVLPFRYITLIDKAQDLDNDGVTDFIDRDVNDNEVIDADEVMVNGAGIEIAAPFLFDANPISLAFARRLFQTSEDLQFSLENDQLGGVIDDNAAPQQVFDTVPGTDPLRSLRRQSRGELSWSMVLVPESAGLDFDVATGEFNPVTQFQSHLLIYKNRRLTSPVDETDPLFNARFDPRLKRAKVFYNPTIPPAAPDPTSTPNPLFRGGNIVIQDDGRDIQIPKNGWVMLTNRFDENVVNVEPGFLHQVAFYRVIGSDPVNRTLTLDGPEFDFGTLDQNGQLDRTETHIVYLQDVVNVYERTIRWEGASSWNQ